MFFLARTALLLLTSSAKWIYRNQEPPFIAINRNQTEVDILVGECESLNLEVITRASISGEVGCGDLPFATPELSKMRVCADVMNTRSDAIYEPGAAMCGTYPLSVQADPCCGCKTAASILLNKVD
jgi:hypothetical protein